MLCVVAACAGPPTEVCGLPTEPPTGAEVRDGFGSATRTSGPPFEEEGSWAPAPSSSIVIGTLTFTIVREETGLFVDDLIADGAFPICVPLGEQGPQSGSANVVDGGFVTDGEHEGGLALLGQDDGLLLGRFEMDLANPSGETLTFSDGVFRVPQR